MYTLDQITAALCQYSLASEVLQNNNLEAYVNSIIGTNQYVGLQDLLKTLYGGLPAETTDTQDDQVLQDRLLRQQLGLPYDLHN